MMGNGAAPTTQDFATIVQGKAQDEIAIEHSSAPLTTTLTYHWLGDNALSSVFATNAICDPSPSPGFGKLRSSELPSRVCVLRLVPRRSHVVGGYSPFPCLSLSLARSSPGLYPCHSAPLGAPQSRRCWQLQAACSTCWLDASARYPVKRKYAFNLSTIDWRGESTQPQPVLGLRATGLGERACMALRLSPAFVDQRYTHVEPSNPGPLPSKRATSAIFVFSKGIRASPTIEGVHSVKEASLQPIPQQHPHAAVQMNQEVHPIL